MATERIEEYNWKECNDHLYRYKLAAQWINDNETVFDVACGIGYGSQVIAESKKINYLGIDKIYPSDTFLPYGKFMGGIDLDEWNPEENWDVSVSFETLEHVRYPEKLANNLKKANRLVILSTPTRPTKHQNSFHLHDFIVDDILKMFDDCNLIHMEDQPTQLSHIFVWQTNSGGNSHE